MPAPGHSVTIGERPAASLAAPSTANGFMVGFAERGATNVPALTISLADAVEKLGNRLEAHPYLYDSLDTAFREGASSIYVVPVRGEKAATAAESLVDSEGKKTLDLKALSPGEWGNSVKVTATLTGEAFVIVVKYEGTTVETSPSLETSEEAIAWAEEESSYVAIADNKESAKPPKTQTVELKGGKSDFEGVKTADWESALAALTRDLGPGQVAAPGQTSEAIHKALLEHARDNNRRALCDLEDLADEEALAEDSLALRAVEGKAARFGSSWAPWAIVPGLSLGTTRTVPYSAVQMGLIARSEGEGRGPNKAAAGSRGKARYAYELTQAFTDAQRETLNDSGINAAILVRGIVTTYGNRTLTNPITDANWKSFSASRLIMGIAARASEVMERYDFEQIDGHGYVFKKLEGDLSGEACMPFYLADELYGQTPAEAFQINTGPDVNTPTSIEKEELKAQIAVRVSPTGEVLETEVVKISASESL